MIQSDGEFAADLANLYSLADITLCCGGRRPDPEWLWADRTPEDLLPSFEWVAALATARQLGCLPLEVLAVGYIWHDRIAAIPHSWPTPVGAD